MGFGTFFGFLGRGWAILSLAKLFCMRKFYSLEKACLLLRAFTVLVPGSCYGCGNCPSSSICGVLQWKRIVWLNSLGLLFVTCFIWGLLNAFGLILSRESGFSTFQNWRQVVLFVCLKANLNLGVFRPALTFGWWSPPLIWDTEDVCLLLVVVCWSKLRLGWIKYRVPLCVTCFVEYVIYTFCSVFESRIRLLDIQNCATGDRLS